MNRREFLKLSAAGALSVIAGGLPIAKIAHAATQSTVVCVKSTKVVTETGFDAEIIRKMIEEGLIAFTGKSSVAGAWREFVSPKDIIGLKINCLGRPLIPTHPLFTEAIIKSLVASGIDENNIIVWDRFASHMENSGYPLNSGAGVKYLASEEGPEPVGYDDKVLFESPSVTDKEAAKTGLARLMTEKTTAMINLPVLKNHRWAGVTLAMKNIALGVTNNSQFWHKAVKQGDPMIPEVCACPAVKAKLRLNILDALQACYDGGPCPKRPDFLWKPGMIYIATDMVAMDTLGAEVIHAKRKEMNAPPIEALCSHIATGAKMKLGTNVKDQIKVVNVTV